MSIWEILYKLLIGPLELLFEVIFVVANRKVSNPAYAIIALSLAMNLLVLPLYRRADAMQEEERRREERMRPWIDHIKKTFSGDERFMMLQTYYRQNDYRPADALKGSVSLLLEIPFFIAAYRFLSGLELLKGVSFGPIADLGAPDQLIALGDIRINLLPILMTTINLVAAAIYMKGMPLKNKVQMYGIAAIFLVLLYNSPAGLVFYWTLNNVFSLGKNIAYKLTEKRRAEAARVPEKEPEPGLIKDPAHVFRASALALTVTCGLLIPSALINDSTEEFLDLVEYYSPNWYIVSAFLLAAGTFLIWLGVFFRLADGRGKNVISCLTAIAAAGGLIDYMFFSNGFGNISTELEYDTVPSIGGRMIMLNLLAIAATAAVVMVVYRYKRELLAIAMSAACLALAVMATINVISINGTLRTEKAQIEKLSASEPEFRFSKQGRNVVVIMMDRMAGEYIPFIMSEKPELKEQFSGFTYYSNVVSWGTSTCEGAPPIYGGYDYTPEKMNARSDELLSDKNNEALKVMPKLFGDAGFDVTICNPTYAGWQFTPDLSIYEDHPEYHTYLLNKRYSLDEYGYYSSTEMERKARLRNFFCYSLFRIAPSILGTRLYQKGNYNTSDTDLTDNNQTLEGSSRAHGFRRLFMANYAILSSFSDISTIKNDSSDNFLMLSNDTTHEEMLLQEPEYLPAIDVDNTAYDKEHPVRTDDEGRVLTLETDKEKMAYQTNVAAMMKLGEWLDYLKGNGVYDNTRIIIVSDHGTNFKMTDDPKYVLSFTDEDTGKAGKMDIRRFQCTLMYKDFGSSEFTVVDDFATNADTPALALSGIEEDPSNPFTGDAITSFDKDMLPVKLHKTKTHNINQLTGTQFPRSNAFEVSGDSRDIGNWRYAGNF